MRRILILLVIFGIIRFSSIAQNIDTVSIFDIQFVSQSNLQNCIDSSLYLGKTVHFEGIVSVDGNLSERFSPSISGNCRPFINVVDTANNGQGGPFLGVDIMLVIEGTNSPYPGYQNFNSGDRIKATCKVGSFEGQTQLTPISSTAIQVIGSTNKPQPILVSVGDLNDSSGINNLVSGEQWESNYVEIRNVFVTQVNYFAGRVALQVSDIKGNRINLHDRFFAQKLPSNQTVNAGSPSSYGLFIIPAVGTQLNYVRGMIIHVENGCANPIGRGYELNPTVQSDYGYGPPYYFHRIHDTICSGDTILSPSNKILYSQGVFYDTLQSATNFDSIVVTILELGHQTIDSIYTSFCQNDSFALASGSFVYQPGIYIDSLISNKGCDSIIIQNLSYSNSFNLLVSDTICQGDSIFLANGYFASVSGSYIDTFSTNSGCDSIVITNLWVNPIYNSNHYDTICSGDSLQIANGYIVSSMGSYVDTFSTVSGCDSIVITNLWVNPIYNSYHFDTICSGDSIILPGGYFVSSIGTYIDSFQTLSGCDSTVITNLWVNPIYNSYHFDTICSGDSIVIANGYFASSMGSYVDIFSTALGCDSTVITNLWVNPIYNSHHFDTICSGDSIILPGGYFVSSIGTYIDSFQTLSGCDSIIISDVQVNPSYSFIIQDTICNGESVTSPLGNILTSSGSYSDTLLSNLHCDSIISIQLWVNPVNLISYFDTICNGDSIFIPNGYYVSSTSTFADTFQNVYGCDSILSTNIWVNPTFAFTHFDTICQGDSFASPIGNSYSTQGTYIDSFVSSNGCDSLMITNLWVNPTFIYFHFDTICDLDTFITPGGKFVSEDGVYHDTLASSRFCDSVLITNLTVLPITEGASFVTINFGDSILVDGVWRFSTGVYSETLINQFGCDSLNLIFLSVVNSSVSTVKIDLYTGDSLFTNNDTIFTTGLYIDSLLDVNGNDSIVIYQITTQPYFPIRNSSSICYGDSIQIFGTFRKIDGVYLDTILNTNFSDTILISTLDILPIKTDSQYIQICNGDSVFLNNKFVSKQGTYIDSFTTSLGCDSILISNILTNPIKDSLGYFTICQNEQFTLPDGANTNTPGLYSYNFTTVLGCDSIIEIELKVNPNPIPSLGPDTTVCLNIPYKLNPGIYSSYIWNTGDTTSTIIANQTKLYEVTVLDTNHCQGQSSVNIEIDICPGIEEKNISFIEVFPNPASNVINVRFGRAMGEASVNIKDFSGKIVFEHSVNSNQFKTFQINVSEFSSGSYLLLVESIGHTSTFKIVIN